MFTTFRWRRTARLSRGVGKNNNQIVAWGSRSLGQSLVPGSLDEVVAVAAGSVHNLALRKNGSLVAWGGGPGSYGQENVPAFLSNVVAIAAGTYHSLALTKQGTVTAWGYNDHGETNVPP